MRKKQPYLVNPYNPLNPYEIINVPHRVMVAETDKKGRFKRLATIKKGKRKKAKKISAKQGRKLFSLAKRKVMKRKKTHKIHRVRKNPILTIGNPITKRRKSMRRKNPLTFIKQREGKELLNLAIDGGVIVVSSTASKLLMDNISRRVKFLSKPVGKIAGHMGLGAIIYMVGSKIKKIPHHYVRLATIGAMLPAIIDVVDYVKSKVAGVKELGYEDVEEYLPETEAYVPETEAYVPETEANDYSQSEY